MHSIILYGSRYGSTRRSAEALSAQTGISAFSHTNVPSSLADAQTIVYLGALRPIADLLEETDAP